MISKWKIISQHFIITLNLYSACSSLPACIIVCIYSFCRPCCLGWPFCFLSCFLQMVSGALPASLHLLGPRWAPHNSADHALLTQKQSDKPILLPLLTNYCSYQWKPVSDLAETALNDCSPYSCLLQNLVHHLCLIFFSISVGLTFPNNKANWTPERF